MYSYLFFGIALLGIFSIIENLKGAQKISLFKVGVIVFLLFLTLSNSLDFLFEIGYKYDSAKSIIRTLGFLSFSNFLFLVASRKVPKVILIVEACIIVYNVLIIYNGIQSASIHDGVIINELSIFNKLNFVILFTFTLSSIFYNLFFIFKHTNENNLYQIKIKRWAFLLLVILMTLLFFMFSVVLIYYKVRIPFDTRFVFIIVRLVAILFILLRPKFLDDSGFILKFDSIRPPNSSLTISSFDFLFYNNHYFLNTEANLDDFALKLNHSKSEVVEFIKKRTGDSFNELLNINRVNYFKELIKSKKHEFFTIEALSEIAGFNNRQSMYNAFKKHQGCTPTEYINNL